MNWTGANEATNRHNLLAQRITAVGALIASRTPMVRRRHFRFLTRGSEKITQKISANLDLRGSSASQDPHGVGRPRTPCDNNMAQLFGVKTPVAAFMADNRTHGT